MCLRQPDKYLYLQVRKRCMAKQHDTGSFPLGLPRLHHIEHLAQGNFAVLRQKAFFFFAAKQRLGQRLFAAIDCILVFILFQGPQVPRSLVCIYQLRKLVRKLDGFARFALRYELKRHLVRVRLILYSLGGLLLLTAGIKLFLDVFPKRHKLLPPVIHQSVKHDRRIVAS